METNKTKTPNTRGIRNNNPGNIRKGCKWKGLKFYQKDPCFCQFIAMRWGVRAMLVTLRTYVTKYKLKTIPRIINRWAPPEDNNNTLAYVKKVARDVGEYLESQKVGQSYEAEFAQAGYNYEFTADDFKIKDGMLVSMPLYHMVRSMCKIESQYDLTLELFEETLSLM